MSGWASSSKVSQPASAKRFAATSPFEPPPMTTASTSAGSAMSAFHQSRVRHHSRPSYPASCMAEPLAVRKTPSSNLVPPKMIANGHVSGWSGPYMASRAVDIQGDRSMGCLGAGPSDTGIPPQRAGPSDTGIPPQRAGPSDTGIPPQRAGPSDTGIPPQRAGPSDTDIPPQRAGPSDTGIPPQRAGPSDTGIPPQRAGPSDTGIPPQRAGPSDT